MVKKGYRAFNGYIFTQKDADLYNNSYYANEDERHRVFTLIINQKSKITTTIKKEVSND